MVVLKMKSVDRLLENTTGKSRVCLGRRHFKLCIVFTVLLVLLLCTARIKMVPATDTVMRIKINKTLEKLLHEADADDNHSRDAAPPGLIETDEQLLLQRHTDEIDMPAETRNHASSLKHGDNMPSGAGAYARDAVGLPALVLRTTSSQAVTPSPPVLKPLASNSAHSSGQSAQFDKDSPRLESNPKDSVKPSGSNHAKSARASNLERIAHTAVLHKNGSTATLPYKKPFAAVPPNSDSALPFAVPSVQDAVSADPVKVILYAYMRSGSTLAGELFDQDEDTFYFFEPVDGMYSYLYGMFTGMFPLDLFFYTDGTTRQLPDYEKEFVAYATLKLLDCDFSQLPADIMLQRFMTERPTAKTDRYLRCFAMKERGSTPAGQVHSPEECKKKLKPYCPAHFDKTNTSLDACFTHLHVSPTMAAVEAFREHDRCMQKAETRVQMCLELITEECRKRRVRSAKTIRMSMEVIERLLQEDPNVKVIYLVRDPRAVVVSRFQINEMSRAAKSNIAAEALMLCERMQADNILYDKLKERYPKQIKLVHYENLAKNPRDEAQGIYRFTQNSSIPESVQQFVQKSMYSSHNSGAFGTSRKNSTATAYQWRHRISRETLADLTVLCSYIINKLGYEV